MMTMALKTEKNPELTTAGKIYILRGFISIGLSGTLFFLAAGRIDIPRGWIYFISTAFLVFISNLIIAKYNPVLLNQRSKIQKGSKNWDKMWLFSFMMLFMYGMPFVAGWEIGRLGNQFAGITTIIGIIIFLISLYISTWAMSINRFFETSVRIQTERNHYVISEGPYKIVRHPGYTAGLLWAFGFPLFIGSMMALYLGIVIIIGFILRTYLEDKTLQKELNGYKAYALKVKYRLIPYIW